MVLKEPTRSLLEIYEEVRRDCTEDLDSVTKLIFLQDFPSYTEIKTILSRKRREVIPADPKSMTDIDLSLPVFLYKDGESVVKGEQVLSDGRRIILFTTKEHLKILARARQILGDGTFRITPLLWCQTFIISAEVSKDVFVPVAFCLLPDKKKESYVSIEKCSGRRGAGAECGVFHDRLQSCNQRLVSLYIHIHPAAQQDPR